MPHYSEHLLHWGLDRQTVFLNHGAFGATPLPVLAQQTAYRNQLEAQPLRFFMRELEPLLHNAKAALADFVGADTHNIVFVKNATQGVNTILHSLQPQSGDEWLLTNLNYGACAETFKWYARRQNIGLNTAQIPFPLTHEDQIVAAIDAAITPRTRLALIDHITSASGIILPVERIVRLLQARGIQVLVDGAHAPGMLPLQLEALAADYYVGNCHKWICAPKGAALLYVRPDRQAQISPLQISHFHDKNQGTPQHWSDQFAMVGTDDYSAYLCVKTAIDWHTDLLPEGWSAVQKHNHDLAIAGRNLLLDRLGLPAAAPDSMIGNLATIPLTDSAPKAAYAYNYSEGLQDILFYKYQIEVPIFRFPAAQPKQWLRIAPQLYNDISQYEYLAQALLAEL